MTSKALWFSLVGILKEVQRHWKKSDWLPKLSSFLQLEFWKKSKWLQNSSGFLRLEFWKKSEWIPKLYDFLRLKFWKEFEGIERNLDHFQSHLVCSSWNSERSPNDLQSRLCSKSKTTAATKTATIGVLLTGEFRFLPNAWFGNFQWNLRI